MITIIHSDLCPELSTWLTAAHAALETCQNPAMFKERIVEQKIRFDEIAEAEASRKRKNIPKPKVDVPNLTRSILYRHIWHYLGKDIDPSVRNKVWDGVKSPVQRAHDTRITNPVRRAIMNPPLHSPMREYKPERIK